MRGGFNDQPGPLVDHGRVHRLPRVGLAGRDPRAAVGVFLPVYLITVLWLPTSSRVAKNRQVKAFVGLVTAAANRGHRWGRGDPRAAGAHGRANVLIALVTLALLLVPKKIPEPWLIVAGGIVGSCLRHVVRTRVSIALAGISILCRMERLNRITREAGERSSATIRRR